MQVSFHIHKSTNIIHYEKTIKDKNNTIIQKDYKKAFDKIEHSLNSQQTTNNLKKLLTAEILSAFSLKSEISQDTNSHYFY